MSLLSCPCTEGPGRTLPSNQPLRQRIFVLNFLEKASLLALTLSFTLSQSRFGKASRAVVAVTIAVAVVAVLIVFVIVVVTVAVTIIVIVFIVIAVVVVLL